MTNTHNNVGAVQGIAAINTEISQLLANSTTRKKNWRIVSIWRELRRNRIPYYFLSQNQIVIEAIPLSRSAIIIGIEKIEVPGASFTVDYYAITNVNTGVKLSLNCASGVTLLQKLVKFSLILPQEIRNTERHQRYEPFKYCDICEDRNRITATVCEVCGHPFN